MNIKAVIGVLLALTTPMSFCLAQETEQAAPLETAQQLITAMNEGNFEAARALFAEDGPPPNAPFARRTSWRKRP